MITVENVKKSFGEVTAVNGVSFSVGEGEITGLLGPNGAGKTTTLRMLTCYLYPDSGSIMVGGLSTVGDAGEVRRKMGYLPESAPLYADMLVHDYLKFVARVRGISEERRIGEIGDICGIDEVMHMAVGELSKGYKQRVGMAGAMIHDPEILILDEPTSGLDPNQIIEIRNLIRELGRKKTVILSTHILSEVEATCDRVIIIDHGSIVADDSTDNLQKAAGTSRHVIVKVAGPSYEELAAEIGKIDGVRETAPAEDEEFACARVLGDAERDLRPDIFKLASKKKWTLYELYREQDSLEKVFRQLTAGGNNG